MNQLKNWLSERFEEVSPHDFYRTIFPSGELEKAGERTKGKYTGIIISIGQERKTKRYTITDDLEVIDSVCASNDFCICSPISYAGIKRTAEMARYVYAIAVDLDKIKIDKQGNPIGLTSLWERHIEKQKRIPTPTFIVSSGSGIHMYYVFDKAIALYGREIRTELQEFKRRLTDMIWHESIVDIVSKKEIQQEGIYQGFRMPGTVTKDGINRAAAFATGELVSIEYMNSFVSESYKIKTPTQGNRISLEDARKLYPDWYKRRIENKESMKTWATNRAVYDWWLRTIKDGATVGHRYYCLMILAMFAKKCGRYDEKKNPNPVTEKELEKDCFELLELFDSLTVEENNHFGNDDVLAALAAYEDKWILYPRKAIEGKSGIQIIPQKRRNYRKLGLHLEGARSILEVLNKNNGKALQGRKSKIEVVQEWRQKNPNKKKADCIRETGLTRPTVDKYWITEETDKTIKARIKVLNKRILLYNKKLDAIEAERKKIVDLRIQTWKNKNEDEFYKEVKRIQDEFIKNIDTIRKCETEIKTLEEKLEKITQKAAENTESNPASRSRPGPSDHAQGR